MIRLYGKLARDFKKKYNYDPKNLPMIVHSGAEAIKAIEANFKGFTSMIKRSGFYKVVRGDTLYNENKAIGENQFESKYSETTWHFMPIAAGCGGKSLGLIIVGAVLTVAGAVTGQGWLVQIGLGLILTGLAQLLAPTPDQLEFEEGRDSYLFNGPANVSRPGQAVPIVFGKTFVSGIHVSAGTTTFDL